MLQIKNVSRHVYVTVQTQRWVATWLKRKNCRYSADSVCVCVSVCPTVHQSPVSTQRHSPRDPFESADATSPSSYCPDYTVRALTDLQLIRVRVMFLVANCKMQVEIFITDTDAALCLKHHVFLQLLLA